MASSQSTTETGPGNTSKKKPPKRHAYPLRSDGSDSSDGSDQSAGDVPVPATTGQGWTPPRGDNPYAAQYLGWSAWTPGRWAWEFLRRNDEFQKACQRDDLNKAQREQIAEKFHLVRFKDYRESYDNERPLFARSIKLFPRRSAFKKRLEQDAAGAAPAPIKVYAPRDNEVVITFRLEPGADVGTKVLTAQLAQARSRLEQYLAMLRKVRSHGSGSQNLDPTELFQYLRTLDLLRAGVSNSEIVSKVEGMSRDAGFRDRAVVKRGSELKTRAKKLASRGYLKLSLGQIAADKS